MYLLDTNVISDYRRDAPYMRVVDFVDSIPEDHLFLSVLTVGEVVRGIYHRTEGAKREKLLQWYEGIVLHYGDRILPVTFHIAELWGSLGANLRRIGRPLPPIDSLIAATALAHDLTVVTRNSDDFEPTGCTIINPWQ